MTMLQQPNVTNHATHEVTNQPPPLVAYDVFARDVALAEGVRREGAGWAAPSLTKLGMLAGSAEAIQWGIAARLGDAGGWAFGTLPSNVAVATIIQRAWPE